MKIRILSLLFIFMLAACSSVQTTGLPTPTQISLGQPTQANTAPDPAADNPVSDSCLPDASLLENLTTALPFAQNVVTPISYGGENTLLVWFASPELDEISLEQKENTAITLAVQAAKTLLETSVCLTEYNSLVFNVVDGSYQLWFSGPVRVADIPGLSLNDAGGGSNGEQGGGQQPLSVQDQPPASENACTWTQAESALQAIFHTPENQAVFYYIREANTSTIYTHWQAASPPTQEEILTNMTMLAAEINCLYPPATGLSATLTGPDGQILANAYLPLNKNGKPQTDKFSYTQLQ